jgi:hypothetical protein
MVVVCKVSQCPYLSKSGFCMNRVLAINANGMCMHIYDKNGRVRDNWQEKIDNQFMDGYKQEEE